MKTFLLFIFVASPAALAAPSGLTINIQGRAAPAYQLDMAKGQLIRILGKEKKVKSLKPAEAKGLSAEANRLLWQAKYREPASRPKDECKVHLRLAMDGEVAKICPANANATGAAMALLYRIDLIMARP